MPGVRYSFKAAGVEDVKRSLEEISQKMKNQNNTIEEQIELQNEAKKITRAKLQEDRVQRDIYLAQHPALLRLNQSLGTMSRILHTVTVAQQAWNISQLLFNQNNQEGIRLANQKRQIEREIAIAKKNGASDEELSYLQEELNAVNEETANWKKQMEDAKFGNIINAATTFGYLATSIGSIVTKAPDMISLFRRIGNAFGGRGFSSPGGISGSSPFGGGGFGSAGGITGSSPTFGGVGRCMSLCDNTVSKINNGISSGIGDSVSNRLKDWLPTMFPILASSIAAALAGVVLTTKPEQVPNTPQNYEVNINDQLAITDEQKTATEETARKAEDIKNIWNDIFWQNNTAKTNVIQSGKSIEVSLQETVGITDGMKDGAATLADIFVMTGQNIADGLIKVNNMLNEALGYKNNSPGPIGFVPPGIGGPIIPPVFGEEDPWQNFLKSHPPANQWQKLGPHAARNIKSGAIVRFAKGGIIQEPTLMMGLRSGGMGIMAERGPEAITPLPSTTGGGDGDIVINLNGPLITLDQLYETFDKKYLYRELRKRQVGR